jgi:protein-S-isoprenylcysteine O-methyltransferase Ste14
MSWLELLAILGALALVLGGGVWFWAWRQHGRAPEAPLDRPPGREKDES